MKFIDRILLLYTCLLVILLTIGALSQITHNLTSLIILALLLPMIGYLVLQIVIIIYRLRHRPSRPTATITAAAPKLKLVNLPPKKGFLQQKSPAFLITISLYTMLLTAIALKTLLPAPPTEQISSITN